MLPPISADEAALLRAVCLDPWDDLPRLVIADWYEGNGEGLRADLIRADCEHTGNPSEPAELRLKAAYRLFHQAAGVWPGVRTLGPLAGLVDGTCRGWPIAGMFGGWADFLAAADAGLWARAPVVWAGYPPGSPGPYLQGVAWGWHRRPDQGRGYVTPRVYERLAGSREPAPVLVSADRVWYASGRAGVEALSRAMVDEGRSVAGLPPLAWPASPDPPA